MLKLKTDSLDGIDDNLRDLYEETDDGFRLKVDGLEDTGALKRAKDREKQAKQEALQEAAELKAQLKEMQDQIAATRDKKARDSGDIEALEKSWQEKLAKRESELQGQVEALTSNITTMLVDSKAESLAAELAVQGSAPVLVPHIKARLQAQAKDGKFGTVVLDAEGKPSALTIDELKQELASNEAFAPLIAGSKGSGSGAASSSQGGGAATTGDMGGDKSARVAAIRSRFPDL